MTTHHDPAGRSPQGDHLIEPDLADRGDSTDEALASELAREQRVVSDVYTRLDELRVLTRDRLADVRRQQLGGHHQSRSERDSFASMYSDRLSQLDAVEDRLVFGRVDLKQDGDEGLVRYIGRLGLSDSEHTPVLTDWRAPAAQPFYQATAAAPGDVVRRRHLLTQGRDVVGVEDDVLDADALSDEARATLAGEGALLAALNAHRTGRMQDIVATIQAEQDAIIRSESEGVLVVQGGPGSGKTAVALHRAAYLLYAHRERLERSGVLLIGPTRHFLRYISKVLPALGETGVVNTTLGDLIPGISASVPDRPEVARVKGDSRMAGVIARAVAARQRIPEREQPVHVGSRTLVVKPSDVAAARSKARRSHLPHNDARVVFVRTMLASLADQYAEQLGADLSGADLADVTEEIRASRDVRIALNLAWMPLTAAGLLQDLYAKEHRLRQAAPDLSEQERSLLARERGAGWTNDDVPLLDEAAELLGQSPDAEEARRRAEAASRRDAEVAFARDVVASGAAGGMVDAETIAARFTESGPILTTAERAAADRTWTYGHIVVDEAQELSPMAWRAVMRRCPSRSMTLVGDVGQTSNPAGVHRWSEALAPTLRDSWRLARLTVNYRTPASVMSAATRVSRALAAADGVELEQVEIVSARDIEGALVVAPELSVADAVSAGVSLGGMTAVIAPADAIATLRAELGAADAIDLDQRLVVLDPVASKGLEFDAVIGVDVGTMPRGDAYVTMTRATRSLTLVGTLPPGLGRQG